MASDLDQLTQQVRRLLDRELGKPRPAGGEPAVVAGILVGAAAGAFLAAALARLLRSARRP